MLNEKIEFELQQKIENLSFVCSIESRPDLYQKWQRSEYLRPSGSSKQQQWTQLRWRQQLEPNLQPIFPDE